MMVVAVLFAFGQVYTGARVEGPSMMPTFNKDYLTSPNKEDVVYYRAVDSYEYGDVVVARVEDNGTTKDIIKRVVGLPGDYIEIKKHSDGYYYLYRNAIRIEEDYIYNYAEMELSNWWFDRLTEGKGHITVGAREMFIMGDNRGNSKDSTQYGCFHYDNVLGVVDYVVDADEIPVVSMLLQLFLPILRPRTII
jgi:signal peptidase I